jgi:hypothetical protein
MPITVARAPEPESGLSGSDVIAVGIMTVTESRLRAYLAGMPTEGLDFEITLCPSSDGLWIYLIVHRAESSREVFRSCIEEDDMHDSVMLPRTFGNMMDAMIHAHPHEGVLSA